MNTFAEKKDSPEDAFLEQDTEAHRPRPHADVEYGKPYMALFLAAFGSLAGWFFGYDQGVTGGAIVMNSFKSDFCIGTFGDTKACNLPVEALPIPYRRFLLLYTLLYNVGCFFGAAFISSYVAERFGRRAILFTASLLFLIGTCLVIVVPGGSKTMMMLVLIGRMVEGSGVGCASFACPLYASEIAPPNLRGMLSGFMQMTIVTGLFLANVINYALQYHQWGWRLSNGVILIMPLIIMIGIFCCPETPRWLLKQNNRQAAQKSLKRIRRTDRVHLELDAIVRSLEEDDHRGTMREFLSNPRMLKRLGIAIGLHIFNQGTGINPIFSYGGILFDSILSRGIVSLLILSGVNLLSTIPALFLIDRVGRRKLLLVFGIGMVFGHLVAATVFATGCTITVNTSTVQCTTTSGILMLVSTLVFVAFYAISWGAVVFVYIAEIFPLHYRAKGIAIATGCNWLMGTLMSYILELIAPLGIHGVFYLFSCFCLAGVIFVHQLCPETRGLLLEDIDQEFDTFHDRRRKR